MCIYIIFIYNIYLKKIIDININNCILKNYNLSYERINVY